MVWFRIVSLPNKKNGKISTKQCPPFLFFLKPLLLCDIFVSDLCWISKPKSIQLCLYGVFLFSFFFFFCMNIFTPNSIVAIFQIWMNISIELFSILYDNNKLCGV